MRVCVIYNPNGPGGEVRVHQSDCPAAKEELPAATSHYEMDAAGQREVAEDFWSDFINEGSMDADRAYLATQFLACTNGLPERPGQDYTMTYNGPQVILAAGTFGTVGVKFIRAGQAYVEASADSGHGPGRITYRGKSYYLSVHLREEHGWDEDPADHGRQLFAPPSYRKAIMVAIVAAVRDYAAAHPLTLLAADINDLQHKQERALAELAQAEQAAQEKREELARLSDDLAYARIAVSRITEARQGE